MRWVARLLGVVAALVLVPLLALTVYLAALWVNGGRGVSPVEGQITPASRPAAAAREVSDRQVMGRALLDLPSEPQILFGDLHVHTHYSADAHLQAFRIRDREGASPPADACDFARFCSQLDFWSINDHAESLTPDHWQRTVEAVRECNALAGDPRDPDLVSFLGWEWSHQATSAESHFGHKNVVLRDTEEGRIPTRPIASAPGAPKMFLFMGALGPIFGPGSLADWSGFHRYARDVLAVEDCPADVAVRDLPADCRESAADPAALFTRLADWGYPAIVIPHGLSWGITNPPHADLANQLAMHDPRWQPLVEVYSGHGNSEVYRDFAWPRKSEGSWSCPGGEDVELCCERAATLARARCEDPESATCEAEVAAAQQRAANSFGGFRSPVGAIEGSTLADWGECDQLQRSFLPSYNYRPRQSTQYGLALGNADGETTNARFRWGLIGASDTHRSRPGTGYREFARELMTDGVGYPLPDALMGERGASFYYTGGLAAVHAASRDRRAIFSALEQRHVYGTSGDRILLWFDLLGPEGVREPMGSEVVLDDAPHFEVRALGAFEQQPGCPAFVHDALPAERIATLCRGECYHPAAMRKRITRIEVVRIRPQQSAGENIRSLIEDPWRSFECPADGTGCVIEFQDAEFPVDQRESLYYVRAIQAPSPAVNGDPLSCERDEAGRCVRARPCGRQPDGIPEDCLAPVEERAWSSPIFADFGTGT